MKKVIMFISLIAIALIGFKINISASQTDDYNETANVFSYNTPYTITYNFNAGPQSDMFLITIKGNLSDLQRVTFVGLDNMTMLDAVNYTSGTGYHSQVMKVGSFPVTFMSQYDQWYSVMSLDVSSILFTDEVQIYFHYTLTSGVSTTQFRQSFLQNVSLYFNTAVDINQLIQDAYDNGFKDAQNLYTDDYWHAYNNGYDDGLDDGYLEGYNDGTNLGTDVRPMFQTLITFIGSVFGLTIFPGVTIGTLASIPIMFGLFKWFMKIFGGK